MSSRESQKKMEKAQKKLEKGKSKDIDNLEGGLKWVSDVVSVSLAQYHIVNMSDGY